MLACDGLSHVYRSGGHAVTALDDVTLAVPPGGFFVLVGPSGCGKTTLLRALAGLIKPTAGAIRHLGDGSPPAIGYVFQEPRLMPWLTVADNVGFALKGRVPRADAAARVGELLAMTGLVDFAGARPHQLSGGMASRVGLARALAGRPDLLLLDEPFAALDAITRRRLQGELIGLWRQWRPTVVFVTHDVEEAVLLADQVCLMREGRIEATWPVPLPRPRDPTDGAVIDFRRRILSALEAPTSGGMHTFSQDVRSLTK